MRDDYKNKLASKIVSRYQDLEERIMQDIVRRVVKAGEITSTADWQINRLRILGYSSEDIEKEIKKAFYRDEEDAESIASTRALRISDITGEASPDDLVD